MPRSLPADCSSRLLNCEGSVEELGAELLPIAMVTIYKQCFCYSNVPTIETKELFVSTANRLLLLASKAVL